MPEMAVDTNGLTDFISLIVGVELHALRRTLNLSKSLHWVRKIHQECIELLLNVSVWNKAHWTHLIYTFGLFR